MGLAQSGQSIGFQTRVSGVRIPHPMLSEAIKELLRLLSGLLQVRVLSEARSVDVVQLAEHLIYSFEFSPNIRTRPA